MSALSTTSSIKYDYADDDRTALQATLCAEIEAILDELELTELSPLLDDLAHLVASTCPDINRFGSFGRLSLPPLDEQRWRKRVRRLCEAVRVNEDVMRVLKRLHEVGFLSIIGKEG